MSSNDNDPKIFDLQESILSENLKDNNPESNDLYSKDIKIDFINIKSSTSEINHDIKKNILEISQSIYNKENEIKKISNEEILLNRHKIESEIFKNQKLLIEEYKKINKNFKDDLDNLKKKIQGKY